MLADGSIGSVYLLKNLNFQIVMKCIQNCKLLNELAENEISAFKLFGPTTNSIA